MMMMILRKPIMDLVSDFLCLGNIENPVSYKINELGNKSIFSDNNNYDLAYTVSLSYNSSALFTV